jgi:hypothetical protein
MQHWLADNDLAGVRDPGGLAKLPEGERQDWQKLWADVEKTSAEALGSMPTSPMKPQPDGKR